MITITKDILDLIDERTVFIDGAMGTMLLDKGIVLGDSAERFSTDFSDIIGEIHKAYFDVGVDIIHTNTYSATKIGLGKKLADKVKEINKRQVKIAKKATPKKGYIAGDIGPHAVLLEKDGGEYTKKDLLESFKEQVDALETAGVDLFSIETMYYTDEAEAAIKAIKEHCDLPIFASMTFDKVAEGYRTPVEETDVKEAINALDKAGADVIGCGCTLGSYEMINLAKEFKKLTKKPVIVQPTAGAPLTVAGKNLYPINPERFGKDMLEMYNLGIDVLGGCCGTTPEHIQEMIKQIKKA
ncbi:MAG: homocysteine S-methyltransferase family protein [Asgard group archaeon]|nr:homocysteine S-methyltransferase family protein [Asgard group archaeon]